MPDFKVTEVGNEIMFYSPVMTTSVVALNKKLRELENNIAQLQSTTGITGIPIKLRINSGGGSLFDGFAAVDAIRTCKTPVHTYIDGGAASAATLMSVVGHKRFMNRHSFMLIHQLSGGMWGKFEEMQDEVRNSQLLMDTIQEIYVKHTKIPKKVLKELLKRDLWLDGKQCKEYGLVDEVL
jgi:ATP-dependent Clp protease protease subunit